MELAQISYVIKTLSNEVRIHPDGKTFVHAKCGKKLSLYVSTVTGNAEWVCDGCNDAFHADGKFTSAGHIISMSFFMEKVR